ncbi:aromatic acid exporter family protein [Streptomyces sp. NPDC048639]|uniref:FUSC family protein n=1 Tax=Streptomyces sp. NPDC048639 TaxID=3365581 RepID=UPI00371F85DA
MATSTVGQRRPSAAGLRNVPARAREWVSRAAGAEGHERHTLLLIAKSTLAATLAWVVSYDVLDAGSPAFAPFSAVLIMHVTVYQSLVQALRYVAAVALGVAVQAASGLLGGPDLATFVLVTLIALALGRWPALGSQGPQVATAAFFAFSTYAAATTRAAKAEQLGEIVILVLIGCGIGVAVNVLVVPPMRYHSAEYGIRTLAHALCDLVSDMHPALRDGAPTDEDTRRWRRRAEQTGELVTQARSGLRTAQESIYYNPRRLLRRHRGRAGFDGYGAVLDALERTLHQTASLTRSLDQWHEDRKDHRHGPFLASYGDFLASVARISAVLGELRESALPDQARELCGLADEAQECRSRVAERAERDALPLADPTRPYGVLLVEATRLMEEFQHTCDVLQCHAER